MKLKIVSAAITSAINTGIVTLSIALVNNGLPLEIYPWLQTWALACAIIFPLSLFVPDTVRRLLSKWWKA